MIGSQVYNSQSLVRFYNRRLEAKGDYDRQWIETPGGALIIVRRHNQQSKMDL